MAKPPTLKQLASAITDKVIERWRENLEASVRDKIFRLEAIRLKMKAWLELISNIPESVVEAAMEAGEWITVDGERYLAGDIRILKEYRNDAAGDPLVEQHDRRKTDHVPIKRLFTPSLFPKLDYDDAREQWLILGEGERVRVAVATPDNWKTNDEVERANWDAQKDAHKDNVVLQKRRIKLFAANPDCKNTDQLIKKLGGWKK
jgi:hypothetical protein